MHNTLVNNKLGKQAEHVTKMEKAFEATINASDYVRRSIMSPILRKPTRIDRIARGVQKSGDISTRTAINQLLHGGKLAQNSMMTAIDAINSYNRYMWISETGGKIANYAVLGGVAGSIGARSASRAFDGGNE